jgi:hypothetical protein
MIFKRFLLVMLLALTISGPAHAQSLLVCTATSNSLFDNSNHGWDCYEYTPDSYRRLMDNTPKISSLLKDGWKFSTLIPHGSSDEYVIIFVKD